MTKQIASVTDSAGNSWHRIGAFAVLGHYSDGELWYASNAGSVTTVTVHTGGATTMAINVQEFSGLDAAPLDVSAGFANTGNLPDSSFVTPSLSGALAVGFIADHGSTQVIAGTSGYVTLPQQNSAAKNQTVSLLSGYSFLSGVVGTHFAASFSSPKYWAAGVAIFKVASVLPAPAPAPVPSSSPNPPPVPAPSPLPSPTPSPSQSGPCYLGTPIRAAFYYPWYPENWTQGSVYPATRYNPWLGFYSLDSADSAVIRSQIASMQYGQIQAGIASWWGQGSLTDGRISELLNAAHGTTFCWTLYYEPATNQSLIASDLAYIAANYANDPNYLHVNGKPVVFVYSRAIASCTDAATWVNANGGQFYLNLQVFGGYTGCPVQPDSWHQYGPAVAEDHQAGYSFTISPGFNKYNEASARLARDPARWQQNVADMVASKEPWQLITTFNEWMEGTSVENAMEWTSASGQGVYLDILHG